MERRTLGNSGLELTSVGIGTWAIGGGDWVFGVDDAPPYIYPLSGLSSGPNFGAVASQAAMDGDEGSWAVLFGSDPVDSTSLKLAVDEDQAKDSERSHTSEQVGFVVFED